MLVALGMAWLGLCRSRVRLAGAVLLAVGVVSPALITPADLLISSDARVIALHKGEGAVAELGSGADRFVEDAFAQYWGVRALGSLDASDCSADACVLRVTAAGPAAIVIRAGGHDVSCADAAMLVSAEPIGEVCPGLPRIDRFTVWREGAQAVWLAPLQIVSDKAWRGRRPWVAPAADQRGEVDLPMAQVE
jgi:competence protein ComEC